MNIFKQKLNSEINELIIFIDASKEESTTFDLSLTFDDVTNIMNMDVLGKYQMAIQGISGTVERSKGALQNQELTFFYKNNDFGSVTCNFMQLKDITLSNFSEMNRIASEQ